MAIKVKTTSLKALHEEQKTNKELTAENKELKKQLASAEAQVTSTQLALCEVYEMLLGGGV